MHAPVKFRVAICGGGIGGLITAVALSAHPDIEVRVYEAATQFGEIGAGIGIFPRPWQIIRKLGLEKELLKHCESDFNGGPAPSMRYRKGDQNPGFQFYNLITDGSLMLFHRVDFQNVLLQGLPKSCQTHCSKRLRSYTQRAPGGLIEILFQDGTSTTCDVLVGADGLKSAVRRTLFSQKASRVESESGAHGRGSSEEADRLRSLVDPVWSGTCAYRAIIPVERLKALAPDHPAFLGATQYLGKNGHLISYPISHGKLLNFAAFTTRDDLENTPFDGPWASTTNRDEFAANFMHWEPSAQQLVECVENPIRWAIHVVKPLDTFVSGRVVLVGDAAHAMTPHQGSGAGLAIEDAYILATVLGHPNTTLDTLEYALQVFDTVRRPHALDISRRSRRNGELFAFKGMDFSDCSEEEVMSKLKATSDELSKSWEWAWSTSADDSVQEALRLLAGGPSYGS